MRFRINQRLLLLLLVALTTVCLIHPLWGQTPAPPRVYEPFEPTDEFASYSMLLAESGFQEALDGYLGLASRHQGTTLGAESLFRAAQVHTGSFGQGEPALALYRRIIAEYPNSRFELRARQFTISLTIPRHPDPARWMEAKDLLAQSYGAPPLSAILKGNRRRALVRQVEAIHPEFREELLGLYVSIHGSLKNDQDRLPDGLELALFGQEAFGGFPDAKWLQFYAINDLFLIKNGYGKAMGTVPLEAPVITPKSPKPGQNKGPRPWIRFQTTNGEWRQRQVDVGRLEFTLDGQDMTSKMRVRSKVDRKLRDGKVYERLTFSVRPETPLSAGLHTVSVVAYPNGHTEEDPANLIARQTWTFTVSSRQDDDEDCRDDDPEEHEEKDDD